MHDDDESPPEKTYPLSPAKMSKTPSWVMLGFLLGGLTVFVFTRRPEPPVPAPVPVAAPEPAQKREPRDPPPLSRIEAVFEDWGKHATWADDKTEVALWDFKEERFADFYEVRRFDNKLYFRSIPQFTRRIIARGKPLPDSPLQFTETEEQYQEWVEYGRREQPMKRMWEKPRAAATPVAPTSPSASLPAIDSAVAPPPPPRPKVDASTGGVK